MTSLQFSSSIDGLTDAFGNAKSVALSWVRTGTTADTVPSYWAGLLDRPMFYSRDVAHQSLAAHLLGLDEENFFMLRHFAASATKERGYYPLWAFMFDGQPAALDYRSDDDFVRETPAPFEIAEKALEMFRWTGDRRYLTDNTLLDYYRHLVYDFVDLHDIQKIGLAGEQQATDIFAGSPTYNEHADLPDLQIAADGVACQWAAMRAIADVLSVEKTDLELAERAALEAERVHQIFSSSWWDAEEGHYIVGLTRTGRATGFASEASWFPMVKRLADDDERTRSHLHQLKGRLQAEAPAFLESCSYLPEAFFSYGDGAEALYWIRYLIDSGSHYPEVPFTIVSHLAAGMTGLRPTAGGELVTRSQVGESDWVEVRGIPFRSSTVSVRHEGIGVSELSVAAGGEPVRWIACLGQSGSKAVEVQPGSTVRLSADVGT
jgi:hypothetical protein